MPVRLRLLWRGRVATECLPCVISLDDAARPNCLLVCAVSSGSIAYASGLRVITGGAARNLTRLTARYDATRACSH
jgi:hypothetical protein